MNVKEIHTIYFVGVGGIGMSALARYFLAQKIRVWGYDKTPSNLTNQLENEGVRVFFNEDLTSIKELEQSNTLVVYTPAVKSENKVLNYFKANDFKLFKRSEILGMISSTYKTLAVAGTHGKTTTSCLLAHALQDSDVPVNAFLGGISRDFNSNLVLSENAKYFVTEADEYDRSFLKLSPDIAIITSLDADHLDIYGSADEMVKNYQDFVKKIRPGGILITKEAFLPYLSFRDDIKVITYGLNGTEDYSLQSLEVKDAKYHFDVKCFNNKLQNIALGLAGKHNVENAIAVIAVADQLEVDSDKLINALASFKGVQRRFDVHFSTKNLVYIDDYAHHPSELDACIQSVRELYPNKKITAVFQPHLFSRTRDFMDDFAKSLSQVDDLILLEIYPAREEAIEGISSSALLNMIELDKKEVCTKEELLDRLKYKDLEVLLTVGAGDIDRFVEPINNWLKGE